MAAFRSFLPPRDKHGELGDADRASSHVGGRVRDGGPFLYEQVCGPGDVMVVPFGVWHVSYALEGPAVVLNITTYGGGPDGEGDGVVADPGPEKCERARPIPVTARRRGAEH